MSKRAYIQIPKVGSHKVIIHSQHKEIDGDLRWEMTSANKIGEGGQLMQEEFDWPRNV